MFQSSFELTGYITSIADTNQVSAILVSKLFRAYGLYNGKTKMQSMNML